MKYDPSGINLINTKVNLQESNEKLLLNSLGSHQHPHEQKCSHVQKC